MYQEFIAGGIYMVINIKNHENPVILPDTIDDGAREVILELIREDMGMDLYEYLKQIFDNIDDEEDSYENGYRAAIAEAIEVLSNL